MGLAVGDQLQQAVEQLPLSGSFGYSQDTQKLQLLTEVTSSYSYLAMVQPRLTVRLRWMATFKRNRHRFGEV